MTRGAGRLKVCRLLLLFALLAGARIDGAERAQKPPPLVLEPGKYSYTFGVPDGWDFSFDQTRELGIPIVFFPIGGSFLNSNTIIYVNEVCRPACKESMDEVMSRIINAAKNDSPNLAVADAPPLTVEGGVAPVRVLTGARDPRRAKEALAFIDRKDVIILAVLSTQNTKSWESDYAAFRTVLAGNRFFTCNSPGLAVPCR